MTETGRDTPLLVEHVVIGPGPRSADMGLLGALCAPTPRLVGEFQSHILAFL